MRETCQAANTRDLSLILRAPGSGFGEKIVVCFDSYTRQCQYVSLFLVYVHEYYRARLCVCVFWLHVCVSASVCLWIYSLQEYIQIYSFWHLMLTVCVCVCVAYLWECVCACVGVCVCGLCICMNIWQVSVRGNVSVTMCVLCVCVLHTWVSASVCLCVCVLPEYINDGIFD